MAKKYIKKDYPSLFQQTVHGVIQNAEIVITYKFTFLLQMTCEEILAYFSKVFLFSWQKAVI